MKTLILSLLAGFVILVGVSGLGIAFDWWSTPFFGKLEARHQIFSGNNRIAEYDKFFNNCGSITALEEQIAIQTEQLGGAAPIETARISANIAGLKGLRATAIAQYNADARKSYTDGQFRSSTLPYQIAIDGKTTCVVY